VHFYAEHRLGGPPGAVIAVLLDPEFHRQLSLPDLSTPEVVEASRDGDEAVLRLRYEYVGQLDPVARRLLGPRKLTWLQDLHLDHARGTGRLAFAAEAAPDRLNGTARVVIEPAAPAGDASGRAGEGAPGGAGSVRRLDGELRVAIRPIGGMAERRILPGLLRRLDIEAMAVDRRVGGS
jgi:hypothetical protein